MVGGGCDRLSSTDAFNGNACNGFNLVYLAESTSASVLGASLIKKDESKQKLFMVTIYM